MRKSESFGDHLTMVCISIPEGISWRDAVPPNGSITEMPYLDPTSSLSLAESARTVCTAPSTSPGLVLWSNEEVSDSPSENEVPFSPGVTHAPSSW